MTLESSRATGPAAALTVILQDDGTGDLGECLSALRSAAGSGRMEILVLGQPGQAPPDLPPGTTTPDTVWLTLSAHAGFAAAANTGFRYSTGKAVLFLSSTVLIQGKCLQKCLSFLNRYTDIGAATCRIVDGEGRFLPICRELPNIRSAILYGVTALPARLKPVRCFLGRWMTRYHTGSYDRYIGWTPAGFLIVRRDALERTGGFSEELTRQGALMDLHYRLATAGYRNACLSEAAATETALRESDFAGTARTRGLLEYLEAHGNAGTRTFFRWACALRQIPQLIALNRHHRLDARRALTVCLAWTNRHTSGNS